MWTIRVPVRSLKSSPDRCWVVPLPPEEKLSAPGFARVDLAPNRGGLTHAAGRVCTSRGPVEVAWRVEGRRFSLEATVPADTPVHVRLPDGSHRDFARGPVQVSIDLP